MRNYWTPEEIEFVKSNLHLKDKELANHVNHSWRTIKSFRVAQSILKYKPWKKIKPTFRNRKPMKDEIQKRIFRYLGVTEIVEPEPEFTTIVEHRRRYRNFSTEEIEKIILQKVKN